MNADKFVSIIKEVVEKSAIEDTIKRISELPEYGLNHKLKYTCNWYNSLDAEGKNSINQIINESVATALFGFFCVLDGVRAIESSYEKGRLELYYKKGNQIVLLNDFDEDFLHDIYKHIE